MWLVVGLGNPGKQYASHRHNVGFMATDELANLVRAEDFREKFTARFAKASHAGDQLVLLQPQTFMNESGRSVQPASAFFKVEPRNVLVVHDELDLPFGEMRLKVGGGHAGHNGLRSLIQHLGTPEFARLRFGVGRPPADFRGEVADFVLSGFDEAERTKLPDLIRTAAEAVALVVSEGLPSATKKLHTKVSAKPGDGRGKAKGAPLPEKGLPEEGLPEKTPARS